MLRLKLDFKSHPSQRTLYWAPFWRQRYTWRQSIYNGKTYESEMDKHKWFIILIVPRDERWIARYEGVVPISFFQINENSPLSTWRERRRTKGTVMSCFRFFYRPQMTRTLFLYPACCAPCPKLPVPCRSKSDLAKLGLKNTQLVIANVRRRLITRRKRHVIWGKKISKILGWASCHCHENYAPYPFANVPS